MEKAADWLNHEIRNWVRWCYSGPYPGPLPPTHCTSLEGGYVSEAYWGSEPDDRPPPIFVEHALIVQRVFDSLTLIERQTVKAEYINVYDSKRWRENGLAAAARYVGVSVPAYEAMILRARQAIARAFS